MSKINKIIIQCMSNPRYTSSNQLCQKIVTKLFPCFPKFDLKLFTSNKDNGGHLSLHH